MALLQPLLSLDLQVLRVPLGECGHFESQEMELLTLGMWPLISVKKNEKTGAFLVEFI
jgi:hypothetical protein